jgi:hypothetical protein
MQRPDWKLALRVAQSFTAWHVWHEGHVGLEELSNRFDGVNKCLRYIPSALRKTIADALIARLNYEGLSNSEVYSSAKSCSASADVWQLFESNGGKSVDIVRFLRFVRGLRRRREWLTKTTELTPTTARERLREIRTQIASCPPSRHSTHLGTIEREFASRMYPRGKLLGIEIEFGCKSETNLTETEPEDYPELDGVDWKTDSSIGSYENDAMCVGRLQEVNLLVNPAREDDWKKLKTSLSWLRSEGGMVNFTCGLHVHIDTRDLSDRRYYSRANLIKKMFKTWAKYTVSKRRATSYYCNLDGTDKYSAVNTLTRNEHNTVEIRIAHSSLNFTKVKLWCDFLSWVKTAKKAELLTFEGFMSSTCDPVVKAYLMSRIVRFADTWNEELPTKLKTQLAASSDDICV